MTNGFDSTTALHMQIHREAAGCCCLDDEARCPRCPTANHAALAKGKVSMVQAENERLRAALTEIAKAEGAYSRDHLTHCENTVDAMQALALAALEQEQPA